MKTFETANEQQLVEQTGEVSFNFFVTTVYSIVSMENKTKNQNY